MDEREERGTDAERSGEAERPGKTEEYEPGDEHFDDPEAEAGADGDLAEHPDSETSVSEPEEGEIDELEQIVSADTVEWTPEDVEPDEGEEGAEGEEEEEEEEEEEDEAAEEEPAAGEEAEQTLVVAEAAPPGWGSRIAATLKAPFAGIRRLRFPIWARFLTGSFLIIASFAAATATSGLLFLSAFAADLRHAGALDSLRDKLTAVEGGEPQTILIIGSDLQPVGNLKKFKGLSDTTMLVRLDPDREAIALFSLPRDLKVEIPGYGTEKLNSAYTLGGPKLTLKTVQQLTEAPDRPQGLEINHVVNVDFTGFARAVNEIDCVYVDVDRRYLHDNDFTSAAADYDEINIRPGYQALCGMTALDYVRYRHTDNDVVRAARQQDFLREARQKVPPEQLFLQRNRLIDIFTEHTTSDVQSAAELLDVLKLFIEARNAPIKEIHFRGKLGQVYVTATRAQINRAVDQFLGIEDTPGARAKSARPDESVTPEGKDKSRPATKGKKKGGPSLASLGLVATGYGKPLARGIRAQRPNGDLPIFYPTLLERGSDFDQKPRVYKINGTGRGSPPDGQRAAYKWVFSRQLIGEYYGFMATAWRNPPILANASEERKFGDRTYKLFYDGDRLRLIAWQDDKGSYWLSNTLIQSLSSRQMIEIARGMRELPPLKRR